VTWPISLFQIIHLDYHNYILFHLFESSMISILKKINVKFNRTTCMWQLFQNLRGLTTTSFNNNLHTAQFGVLKQHNAPTFSRRVYEPRSLVQWLCEMVVHLLQLGQMERIFTENKWICESTLMNFFRGTHNGSTCSPSHNGIHEVHDTRLPTTHYLLDPNFEKHKHHFITLNFSFLLHLKAKCRTPT
jgi:hypothetical protein